MISHNLKRIGFTAVELVFVIVIIAVIAGLALIRVSPSSLLRQELKGSAQRLVGDLRLTRDLAVTHVNQHSLIIVPANHEYSIFDSLNAQVGETRTIDPDISIGGDTVFVFQPLGSASSGTTVSLTTATDGYDINVVAATGMITLTKQ